MRKILIPAAVVAALAAAVAAWFFLRQPDSYKAVPSSAIAVVRVNSWNEFDKQLQNTGVGAELRKTEAYNQLRNELVGIASILSGDKALLQEVLSGSTVVSLHLTSANKYDYLFVTPLARVNDNTILNNIQQVANVKSVNMRIFKGNKVLEVSLNNGSNITAAFSKGLLMLSYTSFLTESALSVLGTGNNIASQKSFCDAESYHIDAAEAKLYVNLARLGVIWPVLIDAKYASVFSDFEKAGAWAVLGGRFKNEEMRCTGAVFNEEKDEKKPENIPLQLALPLIPANAAVADVAVNDTSAYGDDLTGSFFHEWIGGYRAFVTLEPLTGNYGEQNLLLLSCNNESLAQLSLLNLLKAEGASEKAVDTFMTRPVFRMKGGQMLNRFFGNQFCKLNQPYITVVNGMAVFANNVDVMKLALENIFTQNTLHKTFGSGSFKQEGTHWLYVSPQRSAAILNTFTSTGSTTAVLLNYFSQITFTAKQTKKVKEVEVLFKAGGTASATQGLLWKLQLKTAAANTLSLVEANTNSKEIMVQDTVGNVYLVNASGEILFTHSVGERIISGVTQVDYYRNGGLQYLFNSASKIFLLDVNGNDVAGYPLRLSSTATAGMTVWNDTTKKSVRYFIPCANGSIYGYELTGKPVPGWSPRGGVGVVDNMVTVFKHNGKDMLWACNNNGTLWLFDARGNKLWSAENMSSVQGSPAFIQLKDDFVFLSATANQLTMTNAEGVVSTTPLMDSATAFTAFAESDSSYQYLYASGSAVRSYDKAGTFKASAGLKTGTINELRVQGRGSDLLLIATDSETTNLYLMNSSLAVTKQISVSGLTYFLPAAIFSPKETVLIAVTAEGKVACIR